MKQRTHATQTQAVMKTEREDRKTTNLFPTITSKTHQQHNLSFASPQNPSIYTKETYHSIETKPHNCMSSSNPGSDR